MSGWLVKDNGCILKIFSVHKISKNSYLRKIGNSFWLTNFGVILWLKPIENLWYGIAAPVNNCLKNSRRITKNLNKSKRKCKIILKSKEELFLDSISFQTINCSKFYPKQGTHMLFSLILENVLITLIELSLQTLNSQDKLYRWHQLSLKLCLKQSNLVLLSLQRAL